MEYWPGQRESQNGRSLIRILCQVDKICAWPAGAPEVPFFDENCIKNYRDLGLASWSPKMIILWYEFNWNSNVPGPDKLIFGCKEGFC